MADPILPPGVVKLPRGVPPADYAQHGVTHVLTHEPDVAAPVEGGRRVHPSGRVEQPLVGADPVGREGGAQVGHERVHSRPR